MPKRPIDRILAIDPGLREMGFAILAGRRLVAGGAIALRHLPKPQRLREVRRCMRSWLRDHRPNVIVVERTYRHPVPWLNDLHAISRYARGLASRRGLTYSTYSPQAVRRSVMGNGRSKKAEVATVLAAKFPSLRVYLAQDRRWKERFWLNMFDALALAIHHQTQTQPPSRSR